MKQFIYICMILKVSFDVVVVVGSLRAGAETLWSAGSQTDALLCSAQVLFTSAVQHNYV